MSGSSLAQQTEILIIRRAALYEISLHRVRDNALFSALIHFFFFLSTLWGKRALTSVASNGRNTA